MAMTLGAPEPDLQIRSDAYLDAVIADSLGRARFRNEISLNWSHDRTNSATTACLNIAKKERNTGLTGVAFKRRGLWCYGYFETIIRAGSPETGTALTLEQYTAALESTVDVDAIPVLLQAIRGSARLKLAQGPEVAFDERADLFTLAAILYELMSGLPPTGKLEMGFSIVGRTA